MEENTLNQEQTTTTSSNEDEGYFDDVDMNDIEITPDDNVTSETESTTTDGSNEEQAEEAPFMNVRYNKEDVGLTQEQAIEYAQKGMNYDKVIEKYNGLNSNLERLANANGLSVDEYLDRLEETQFNFEVSQEMESLRNEYPDASDEILQRLAEQNVNTNRGYAQLQRQTQLEEQQSAEQDYMREDVQQFMDLYPNTNIRDLPKEVWDLVENGKSLVYAYGMYRNKVAEQNKPQIEAKQKAQALNDQNRNKSYGDTSIAGRAKQDDFLDGWNSAD